MLPGEKIVAGYIWRACTGEARPFPCSSANYIKNAQRHPYYHQCTSDLRLVFRAKGDEGARRTEATPDTDELLSNLNIFVERWNHISYN